MTQEPPEHRLGETDDAPPTQEEEGELAALARLLSSPSFDFPPYRQAALRAEVLEQLRQHRAASKQPGAGRGLRWTWWHWVLPPLGAAGAVVFVLQLPQLTNSAQQRAQTEALPARSAPPTPEEAELLAAQAIVLRTRLASPLRPATKRPEARVQPSPEGRQLQAALTGYRRRLLNDWEAGR